MIDFLGYFEKYFGVFIIAGGVLHSIINWPRNDSTGIGSLFSLILIISSIFVGSFVFKIGSLTLKRDRLGRWLNILLSSLMISSFFYPAGFNSDIFSFIFLIAGLLIIISMFFPSVKSQFSKAKTNNSSVRVISKTTYYDSEGKISGSKEIKIEKKVKKIRHPLSLLMVALLLVPFYVFWIIPFINASNWVELDRKKKSYLSGIWATVGFFFIYFIDYDNLSLFIYEHYDYGISLTYGSAVVFCLLWYIFDAHKVSLYIQRNDYIVEFVPKNYKKFNIISFILFLILFFFFYSLMNL
jgi:hypothetical protein